MKKSVSMYGRVTPAKKPEAKPSSRPVQKGSTSQGNGGVGSITPSAAAKDRRSPVVTDQTIATNSVIQAANDPKIKELVIKQQMIDRKQRDAMDKKRPRADGTNGPFSSLEHSGSFSSSGHHHSHSGQFYHKHSSFDETNASSGDHHYEADRGFVKYVPSSPESNHHAMYNQQGGATPGSYSDTVLPSEVTTPNGGGIAQLDDVNSEITADAGYMSTQKGPTVPITHMEGIPSAGVSPNNCMMASSPPVHMNMYMDMNSSLLHDPHHAYNHSGPRMSPRDAGAHNAHLPNPPVLALPTAVHAPAPGSYQPTAQHGHVPPRVHTAYEAAFVGPEVRDVPDPKGLDDTALQAAYFKFLLEMETRGLHSMSLSERVPAPAPVSVNVSVSSSSSCIGGNGAAGVVPTTSGSTARSPSPSMAVSPGGTFFLPAQVAEFERASGTNGVNPHTPRAPTTPGIAAKTTPSTAHSAVPSGNNSNNASTPNAADIRKHIKRSKSGGSEASFYPTSLFPGGVPPPVNTSVPPPGSGRRTPSSPMMRHLHSNSESYYEPEDSELKDAFGQSRYPGSPSNLQYSGYSPSYLSLSSNAPAPTYYAQHNSLTQSNAHSNSFGSGGHSHGTTPTSIAAGSTTWGVNGAAHPTTTGASISSTNSHHHSGHSRSASRCSGVAPPMGYDSRDDQLFELRPAVRSNCLSTLPSAWAANGPAPASATLPSTSTDAAPSRVDLKTPKFVRKLQEGMGAALLGLTGNSNREDDSSSTGENSAASARVRGGQPEVPVKVATSAHHAKDSRAPQSVPFYADTDNSIDAVMAAGGLDQLLLPGRAKHRGSSLIPDDHSAFSHGSMSSLRSNGKKSSKSRQ